MAQRADITDQPAIDPAPLGRWGTLRLVESTPEQPAAAGPRIRRPRDGPRTLGEPRDPGLVWIPGLPVERASAELTMRDLLSTWRSAERRLEGLAEGEGEWSLIRAQVVSLRVAHRWLFAQIRRGMPTG